MIDFLGYNRDVRPNGQIATSEFVNLYLGSRISLLQQCTWNYRQNVRTNFEGGSATLFFSTGQASGTIAFTRLVGTDGFLSSLSQLANSCGKLLPAQIKFDGTGGCSAVQMKGKGIQFMGGVVADLSGQWSVGGMDVAETATLQVAGMMPA